MPDPGEIPPEDLAADLAAGVPAVGSNEMRIRLAGLDMSLFLLNLPPRLISGRGENRSDLPRQHEPGA